MAKFIRAPGMENKWQYGDMVKPIKIKGINLKATGIINL